VVGITRLVTLCPLIVAANAGGIDPPSSVTLHQISSSGKLTTLILVHPLNALFPIDVIESDISRLVKPVQSLKASFPLVVTDLGISMLVKLLQDLNAP